MEKISKKMKKKNRVYLLYYYLAYKTIEYIYNFKLDIKPINKQT